MSGKKFTEQGPLLILLSTCCWSLSGVLTKALSMSPLLSNALRSFIGIFILLAFNRWRIKLNRTVILAGACGTLMAGLYFIALRMTGAANAIVIQYTSPIFVLVFTCLREKHAPTAAQLGVVTLAFAGVAIVFGADMQGGSLWGNLAALASGLTLAGMFFINRLPGASPLDASIVSFFLSILCGLFYLNEIPGITRGEWGILLLMGTVQHACGYLLFSMGIRFCSGFSSSLIGMLETVLVPLWVFLAFGETPSLTVVLGSACILGAVLANLYFEHRASAPGN